ncbi:MAG: hypothetical protein ACC608_03750 [Anaerofustis sp.]
MNVMTRIVCALQIILLGVAVFTQSFYMLDYAAVCLRLGIFRLAFAMLASLDEEMQKRKCRFSGLCMFPQLLVLPVCRQHNLFLRQRQLRCHEKYLLWHDDGT